MKLDPDCIRDLLIAVEETTYFTEDLEPIYASINEIHELNDMKKYSRAEIVYTAEKLDEAGLMNVQTEYASNRVYACIFSSLTYEGHKYLDNLRSPAVWANVKKYIIKAGGSVALPLLLNIAENVIARQLGLSGNDPIS